MCGFIRWHLLPGMYGLKEDGLAVVVITRGRMVTGLCHDVDTGITRDIGTTVAGVMSGFPADGKEAGISAESNFRSPASKK